MKDETLLPDEQLAFEKFMEDNFCDLIDRRHVKNGDGGYFAWDMVVAWIVWQGRAALQSGNSAQPVTVPAGYVLVPVEPTITILDEIDAIFYFGAEDSKDAWHRLLAAAPKIPDAPKANNVIGHYQGVDGKEQDIITLAAKKGV
ncbi:MAG: hypothetical protein E7A50_07635 [Clostridiales bacterium]|nr:hypothetical protein [Clostridiales bacterium]